MKILTAPQLRALDELTVHDEKITSLDLMERAVSAFVASFKKRFKRKDGPVLILCGTGNNGGDGLVAARLLHQIGYKIHVLAVFGSERSPDNETNLRRIADKGFPVDKLTAGDKIPTPAPGVILVDALFGTGLSRKVDGYWAEVLRYFNEQEGITRVALDIPSGLFADEPSEGEIFRADTTFTLGLPKSALFAPENTAFVGETVIVPFRLHNPAAVAHLRREEHQGPNEFLEGSFTAALVKKRHVNDHKGTFGHALLVAGSFGKMGAAVIAARAVLRSGAGLVTCHVPRSGYEIMQITFPEAMCTIDAHRYNTTEVGPLDAYQTIGIGPGIGTEVLTAKALRSVLSRYDKPMVLDADALNLMAKEPSLLELVPKHSILTPHPKEFERLFGTTENSFARWRVLSREARSKALVIILKTGYTSIATPDGNVYVNPTGNPGMGTAGTGDALTGLLTGLLAQGYSPREAALLGVYLHGLAGDIAAEEMTQQFLLAEDVVSHIGAAYRRLAGEA